MANPKIRRYPPARGLVQKWCLDRDDCVRAWPQGVPPIPDWGLLDKSQPVLDDMPPQPEEDDIVFEEEFEHLELSEHQKLMLLPVALRIKQLVYPSSIKARIKTISKDGKKKTQEQMG